MSTIIIEGGYFGPPKGELIDSAFAICGLSSAEFEIGPEETQMGVEALNSMMAEWEANGINLGYNFPDYQQGSSSEASGISAADQAAIVGQLALRLAPRIGKTIAPDVRGDIAASFRALQNGYATIPSMAMARHTPRGTGHRRRTLFVNEE